MKSTSKMFKAVLGSVILAFSLVAILPVTALAQSVSFSPATNFGAGPGPVSVAIGDLNGDGKPDLAVGNYYGNNVSILLGTGTGSFGPATNFAAGSGSFSVAIGDLNGDGKPDLAVTNYWDNNVSILLGDGTGSFGPATNFAVGSGPGVMAIGDLNGDGKPDLAVTNGNTNTVSILLGTGTGSFGPFTNFAALPRATSVAIGDLNGDGKPDLAVANVDSSNVSILLGDGTGSFGLATNFAAGSGPYSVAIGDLNGDGKSDLAVANALSNDVSILLGDGHGSFGLATNFAAGDGPFSVAIGDFNGDGKPDLATANDYSPNVSILLGDGTGSFGPFTNFAVGTQPYSVAIGDLNGDGKPDLAVADVATSIVSVLLNTTVFPPPPVGTLTSIAVTPTDPTINVGQTQLFTATGTFSDGSSSVLTLASGAGTWSTKAPLPTGNTGHAVASINGLLYSVGGTNWFCGAYSALEAYDPLANTWTAKTSMPTARWGPSAGEVNGILYVLGGNDSCGGPTAAPYAVNEAYNPATNSWTTQAPMPTGRSGGHAVGVVNGILYAVGGDPGHWPNDGPLNTVEAYDPVTNTWTTKAPMPTARTGLAVGVVNNIVYAVGGANSSGFLATVEAYDPATNTWTTKAPMPTARVVPAAGVVNNILYVVGGLGLSSVYLATVEAYDPGTNTWTTKESMPTARDGPGVGVVNNVLYAVGGQTPTAPVVTTVEAYTPESGWSSSNTGVATIDASGLSTGASPGTTTITATSGSISDSTTLTVVDLDVTAPSIQCDSPDGQWHAADVSLHCTAEDTGSGLADPADASFTLSTSVAPGSETSNASTGSRNICDIAGNCATAGPIGGNKVDKKAPSITISSPGSGASYVLNQGVASNYGCVDGGSGVGSCAGPVASGANFSTASVGLNFFTVTATDAVGNTATLSSNYSVVYLVGGSCMGSPSHQILQPINVDGSSVFKKGSTVPAKFRVCDAGGNSVGTPGVVASFFLVQTITGTVATDVNEAAISTTPDTAFRWDSTGQQWIFNINTKSLSANVSYVYRITLNDGTFIQYQFGLK